MLSFKNFILRSFNDYGLNLTIIIKIIELKENKKLEILQKR